MHREKLEGERLYQIILKERKTDTMIDDLSTIIYVFDA